MNQRLNTTKKQHCFCCFEFQFKSAFDQSTSKSPNTLPPTTQNQSGIPIRFPVDYDGLVHHKFCLIDAIAPPEPAQRVNKAARVLGCPQISSSLPPNGVLISGSMNWTMQAISGNWENIVITSMPRIVEPFAQEFEKMWREFHRPIGMIQDLERLERKTEAILAVVSPHLN